MSIEVVTTKSIKLFVDPGKGTYSAWLLDGSPLLLNAVSKVKWRGGELSTADDNLIRRVTEEELSDKVGYGKLVTLECVEQEKQCTLTVQIKVYDDNLGIFVEATASNHGSESLTILDLQPVVASLHDQGAVYNPLDDSWRLWLLTNGYMFMDVGRAESIMIGRSVQSRWNIAAVSRNSGTAFVAGYVSFDVSEGEVVVESDWRFQPDPSKFGLGLMSRSLYAPKTMLHPGGKLNSDWFGINWGDSAHNVLIEYAKHIQAKYQIEKKQPLMGWCSWYYTYHNTSEEEILRNARFISEHLKDYGLKTVQIDDGYQHRLGDWEAHDEKFPNGMGYLADEIKKLGLIPGLWVAPYSLSEESEVAKNHPEWCGKSLNGERKRVGSGYSLDPTHPDAREWLKNLMTKVRHEWGYEMVKIDFSYSSILEIEEFHDNTQGRAGAYRTGLQTIREAIGNDCHLLDCGPMNAVGIADSWRTEWDFDRLNWRQYTKELESNIPAIAKRYYMHNHLWSNDNDIIGFGLLNEDQGRSLASVMALSGGTVLSGDQLYALPESKIDMLKKILPVYGESARTVDLFESDFPTLYQLDIQKSFGAWTVLGVFNWSETSWTRRELNIKDFLADVNVKELLVFEFWTQQVVPVSSDGIISVDLKPGECAVFAIRKKEEYPVLIGTDRHVLQGAVEFNELNWNESTLTLSGELNGVARSNPTLTIWVPDGYEVATAKIDGIAFTTGEIYENLMRIRIPATVTGKQQWSVTFKK
jgi:hypothetical protein